MQSYKFSNIRTTQINQGPPPPPSGPIRWKYFWPCSSPKDKYELTLCMGRAKNKTTPFEQYPEENLTTFILPFRKHANPFLAALSSSRSLVVGRSVGPLVGRSVGPSVHLCENGTFRLLRVSKWVNERASEWVSDKKKLVTRIFLWLKKICD